MNDFLQYTKPFVRVRFNTKVNSFNVVVVINTVLRMIPKKWITFDLIQDSVRKSEQNTETELKSFSVHEAVGKAENYCSDIVRVSSIFTTAGAVATEQRRSFIVKSSIETTEYDSLNEEVSYLPKEIKIYDQILPAVAQLLLSIDDDTQIAPK